MSAAAIPPEHPRRLPNGFELAAWVFVLWIPFTDLPLGAVGLLFLLACAPFLLLFRRQASVPPALIWLGILATYQIVSALVFGMPLSNLLEFTFYRRDAKFFIAYLPMVLAVLVNLDPKVAQRMLLALVGIATAVALFGTVEYALALGGIDLHLTVGGGRYVVFHGVSRSHNAAGGLFAVITALAFGQLLTHQWVGWRAWATVIVLTSGTFLTLSRAFIFAFMIVIGTATLVWGDRRAIRAVILAGVALLPFVGGGLVGRILELRNYEEVYNARIRLEYWARALDTIRRSPFVGIGYSRFNDEPTISYGGQPGLVQWKRNPPVMNNDAHAHNAVLMVWAETGVIGVMLWIGFLGGVAVTAIRRLRSARAPPEVRGLAAGSMLAFAMLVFASLVANNVVTPSSVWPAGFFTGAMLSWRPGAESDGDAAADQ